MTDPSKDWSPAEPLRKDATDEQIGGRFNSIFYELGENGTLQESAALTAREFAAARMAEQDAELVRLRADAARLDWLDERSFMAYRSRDAGDAKLERHACVVDEDARVSRRGHVAPTLRAAIDAARHSSEGTP